MVDLILIGAIIHFCVLGYRLTQAYDRYVDAVEDHIYTTVEVEDDDDY